jgi:DNA-binding IscR family transcriptional regulator
MVVSTRAPGGGFKLARSPGQLTMLQIVEALEGPVDTASVLGDDLLLGRNDATARHLRRWRQQVARVVRCMLEETTLNDIVG